MNLICFLNLRHFQPYVSKTRVSEKYQRVFYYQNLFEILNIIIYFSMNYPFQKYCSRGN